VIQTNIEASLVHWEGYPTEEDTWEPIKNIKNAPELIKQFHRDYPDKPALPTMQIQLMHREEELEELKKHPKLYHYVYGTPSEGLRQPNKPMNLNIIIALSPHGAGNLL
jgi:hypothetical protein